MCSLPFYTYEFIVYLFTLYYCISKNIQIWILWITEFVINVLLLFSLLIYLLWNDCTQHAGLSDSLPFIFGICPFIQSSSHSAMHPASHLSYKCALYLLNFRHRTVKFDTKMNENYRCSINSCLQLKQISNSLEFSSNNIFIFIYSLMSLFNRCLISAHYILDIARGCCVRINIGWSLAFQRIVV